MPKPKRNRNRRPSRVRGRVCACFGSVSGSILFLFLFLFVRLSSTWVRLSSTWVRLSSTWVRLSAQQAQPPTGSDNRRAVRIVCRQSPPTVKATGNRRRVRGVPIFRRSRRRGNRADRFAPNAPQPPALAFPPFGRVHPVPICRRAPCRSCAVPVRRGVIRFGRGNRRQVRAIAAPDLPTATGATVATVCRNRADGHAPPTVTGSDGDRFGTVKATGNRRRVRNGHARRRSRRQATAPRPICRRRQGDGFGNRSPFG